MTDTRGQKALQNLEPDEWLQAIDDVGEDRGYFEPVGPDHSAIFTDEGPVLLVTFETIAGVRARPEAHPLGFDLADARGWSQLTMLAHCDSWFRDRRVYGYFDRLVDDGFFEDFDQVIFLGAGMCGYAAAAFSVAAPGSTVIAVQPAATLDPLRAGWDRRFLDKRRLDFTDRYGFAPRMTEAADRVFVVYDPDVEADAIHAAFFTCENTHPVRMRHFGSDLLSDLSRMGVLDRMLDAAVSETGLTDAVIHRGMRARGGYIPYLRSLLRRLSSEGRWYRVAKISRMLAGRPGGRRFRKLYTEAVQQLRREGIAPPPTKHENGANEAVDA